MKKILWLFFLLTFIAFVRSQSLPGTICAKHKQKVFVQKAKTRALHKPKADSSIDVKYYKLDLALSYTFRLTAPHYSNQLLEGNVTILMQLLSDSATSLYLNLKNGGLTVDTVFSSSQVCTFTHESDLIKIQLPQKHIKGDLIPITVQYHGLPIPTGFGSFVFGTQGSPAQPAIHSLSQPFGTEDWFPCKNDPADKADSSDVWITAPADMVSVSNGVLQEVLAHGATNTYKWKSRYPIAPYLISIALSNYEQYQQTYTDSLGHSMPISNYVFPEHNTQGNKELMDETLYMMNLFTSKFGPYPFLAEKYGHAQIAIEGGGMEHQTCSSVSDFGVGLVAHELAHQWFGDMITCESWEHIWLNEGFASFAEAHYSEAKRGRAAYDGLIVQLMSTAMRAQGSLYVTSTDVSEIFSSDRTYHKGALVLHMLRGIVGDTVFFQTLKTYLGSKHAYGSATTEDFQAIAEVVSGRDLDYFFTQWVYGHNYPKYQFGWRTDTTAHDGAYHTHFEIKQEGNSPSPLFFTMPIKLRLTFEDSSKEELTFFNDRQYQSFNFSTPKRPVLVDFDPDNAILKRVSYVNIEDTLTTIDDQTIHNLKHTQLSPNPAQDAFKLSFELPMPAYVVLRIYSIDGRKQMEYEEGELIQGKHDVHIDCATFPKGTYIVQLIAGDTDWKQLVLLNNR